MKKHRPTKYMTISPQGTLTFGWRCRCGIPSRRFRTSEARSQDMVTHRGNHKALRS